jgi:hypothetical protein
MNNKGKKERRKHERHYFRGDIAIDDIVTYPAADISEEGLYIYMMQPLEKGRMVRVTIPFKGNKIVVKAQVRSSHPNIGTGIVFVDLTAEQRGQIRSLIKNISKKPPQS